MIIEYAEHFERAFRALPAPVRKKFAKSIARFEADPRHPSLHVEKVDNRRDIWSCRVDRNYRFTFQWIPEGVRLRNIGPHDAAYRSP